MPGAQVNAAALMRRKMNIVLVLFIVLKGTATCQVAFMKIISRGEQLTHVDVLPACLIIFYVSHFSHRWCQPRHLILQKCLTIAVG